MSWIDSIYSQPNVNVTTKLTDTRNGRATSFFEYAGNTVYYNLNTEVDYKNVYNACAPVKAIINRRAQMFVNGRIDVINNNTENKQRGQFANDLLDRLRQPNILQSDKQFRAQQNVYIDTFGYCPVLRVEPAGMEGQNKITSLWNLPPWLFDIEFTGQWMEQVELTGIYKQFYLDWNGTRRKLNMKNVFLILDNSIGTDNDGNLLMPDARLKGNELDVSNEVAAKKSANTLITKKGAIGILSNESKDASGNIPLIDGAKEEIQSDFRRYGLTGQEFQIIITDASLKWQSMTVPVKDLMLFETMTASKENLCDALGMYSYIMAGGKGTTFANLNEAKKAQYQDFIIPDAEARMEQMSRYLIPKTENCRIVINYDHIEVLQESKKSNAEAMEKINAVYDLLYKNNLATLNMWNAALGLPAVPDGDKYIFEKTDTVPLAIKLGVGGLESLQAILMSQLQPEQKQNVLELVFNIEPASAAKLAGVGMEPVDPIISIDGKPADKKQIQNEKK